MSERVLPGGLGATLTVLSATGTAPVDALGRGYDLECVRAKHAMHTVVTGGPTGVSIKLQGSLDGANWYDLATSTSTTGDYQTAVDKPARYLRVNLGTLTGGTSPTVQAFIGSC